jgi:thymidine kinase
MAKLYFYYSAMNAGKSMLLLQSAYNYTESKMRVLLLLPGVDTRAGGGVISSRIGIQHAATTFSPTDDLVDIVKTDLDKNGPLHCVLVDEAQFMTRNHVAQLCKVVDKLDIPVLAYGLRTDFKGEPFEGSKYLLAWADKLNEVKSICTSGTGKKATMVLRLDSSGHPVKEGAQIEIGGNATYASVSRAEFTKHVPLEKKDHSNL